jgi:hypothetical protein
VQTVKLWSNRAYYDTITDEDVLGDMNKRGIIQIKTDTSKKAGDTIHYHFLRRISDKGLRGDQSATGNESALVYDQDSLEVNALRQPLQIPNDGTISRQRVNFDLEEDGYQVLRNWQNERMIAGLFNQLAGNTATTITYDGVNYTGDDRLNITGLNAAIAPSANNILRAGTSNTTDQAVGADSAATLTMSLIEDAEKAAATNRPYIMPLDDAESKKKGVKYRCYVHIEGLYQLINDTSSPVQYREIFYNQISAGGSSSIGPSIIYSQTEIIGTDKIPHGVNSSTSVAETNTRRAVFVGKEAGCVAFGQGYEGAAGFKFSQDLVDIEQWRRIALRSVHGSKKTAYNSTDRGVIVLTHYVA